MTIKYFQDGYSPWAVAPDGTLLMMMCEKMSERLKLDSNPWLPCIVTKDMRIELFKFKDLKFLPCIHKDNLNGSNIAQLNLRVRDEYLNTNNPIRKQLLDWFDSPIRHRLHYESIESVLKFGSGLITTDDDEVRLSGGFDVWDLRMVHFAFRRVPAFLLVEADI